MSACLAIGALGLEMFTDTSGFMWVLRIWIQFPKFERLIPRDYNKLIIECCFPKLKNNQSSCAHLHVHACIHVFVCVYVYIYLYEDIQGLLIEAWWQHCMLVLKSTNSHLDSPCFPCLHKASWSRNLCGWHNLPQKHWNYRHILPSLALLRFWRFKLRSSCLMTSSALSESSFYSPTFLKFYLQTKLLFKSQLSI